MPHVRIDNSYYRTPEFITFSKTLRSRILEFLIAAAVRDSVQVRNPRHGAHWIYKNQFLNGNIVGRYSQEDMAKYFTTGRSRISTEITKLHDAKLLRKIENNRYSTTLLYYKVGYWTGTLDTKSYEEHLFFDIIYGAYANIAKENRRTGMDEASLPELQDMVDNLDPEDSWYEDDYGYLTERISKISSTLSTPVTPCDVGRHAM